MDFLFIFSPMPHLRIREGFPGQRLVVVPPQIVSYALRLPVCELIFPTHIGGFNQAKYHFVERRHGTAQYILIICLAGLGSCRVGAKTWLLEKGHGIVLPPDTYHRYQADQEQPWTILWVHFVGNTASAFGSALGVTLTEPRFWIGDLAVVIDAFEETYRLRLKRLYRPRFAWTFYFAGPPAWPVPDTSKIPRSAPAPGRGSHSAFDTLHARKFGPSNYPQRLRPISGLVRSSF